MPVTPAGLASTRVAVRQDNNAARVKREKDIEVGVQLIGLKTNFVPWRSPKGIVYSTWSLFVKGVFGFDNAKANRFINAAEQQTRLQKYLKVTVVAQPSDTLWTCRKISNTDLKAAWTNITKGDKKMVVENDILHKAVCMHESVKERDTRERRVSSRMLESEFVKLIDAVNDRIGVVNAKIPKTKGCTLTPEPTYTFDQKSRKVVDTLGVAYETSEWLEHVADYLNDTNHI